MIGLLTDIFVVVPMLCAIGAVVCFAYAYEFWIEDNGPISFSWKWRRK